MALGGVVSPPIPPAPAISTGQSSVSPLNPFSQGPVTAAVPFLAINLILVTPFVAVTGIVAVALALVPPP